MSRPRLAVRRGTWIAIATVVVVAVAALVRWRGSAGSEPAPVVAPVVVVEAVGPAYQG